MYSAVMKFEILRIRGRNPTRQKLSVNLYSAFMYVLGKIMLGPKKIPMVPDPRRTLFFSADPII